MKTMWMKTMWQGVVGDVIGILLLCTIPVSSLKFLLVPVPLYSHCVEIVGVGRGLVARGHDVSIFVGSNFDAKDCFTRGINDTYRIKPIVFQSRQGLQPLAELSRMMSDVVLDGDFNLITHIGKTQHFVDSACENTIGNKESILRLKRERFDMLVVDGFFVGYCTYIIPHILKTPFVSVSTVFNDFVTGRPPLLSIHPYHLSPYTGYMSFLQRVGNTLLSLMMYELSTWTVPTGIVREFDPELTWDNILSLPMKAELFLYNTGPILNYPKAKMPNHVDVGGIATIPAQPLSGELQKIYEKSTAGVIVVSFGSLFGKLTAAIEKNLLNALNRLPQDIVWKYSEEGRYRNVFRSKWLPQNDLLGNSKTSLFISHCGVNGLYEALYHGVPLLCTPLFADQFFNAERIKYWKAGSSMDIISSSEDEMYSAITSVLADPSYTNNMKKASAMFHAEPFTPSERAAIWVEYVQKFGGEHLRSRSTELSTFALLGYDVLLFMFSVVLVFIITLYRCLKFCIGRLCKGSKKTKTS